jgi:hypothetical protein
LRIGGERISEIFEAGVITAEIADKIGSAVRRGWREAITRPSMAPPAGPPLAKPAVSQGELS